MQRNAHIFSGQRIYGYTWYITESDCGYTWYITESDCGYTWYITESEFT